MFDTLPLALILMLRLCFLSAAAKRRGSQSSSAGRGHTSAAQESAEEGRGRADVPRGDRVRCLGDHAIRHVDTQGQQTAG